jgi:hypothetical protein
VAPLFCRFFPSSDHLDVVTVPAVIRRRVGALHSRCGAGARLYAAPPEARVSVGGAAAARRGRHRVQARCRRRYVAMSFSQ